MVLVAAVRLALARAKVSAEAPLAIAGGAFTNQGTRHCLSARADGGAPGSDGWVSLPWCSRKMWNGAPRQSATETAAWLCSTSEK